ncbi:hypothetical protein [Sorangium sp. So ce388]|uniref:hypothetical protein n=1 Tax=Sorangium sp. So ce388 TaxID=3133309 RepID=UPI003F5C43E7
MSTSIGPAAAELVPGWLTSFPERRVKRGGRWTAVLVSRGGRTISVPVVAADQHGGGARDPHLLDPGQRTVWNITSPRLAEVDQRDRDRGWPQAGQFGLTPMV